MPPEDDELERLLREQIHGYTGDNDGEAPPEEAEAEEPDAGGEQEGEQGEVASEEGEGQVEEPEGQAEEPEGFQAPEHWSQADRDFLEQFEDDDAKRTIVEWRKQIERGADAKYQEAAEARRFQEALKPITDFYKQAGQDPDASIRGLVQLDAAYRSKPMETILYLVQNGAQTEQGRSLAGSDQAREFVRQIAQTMGVQSLEEPQEDWLDPAVGRELKALRSEVANLQRQPQPQMQQQNGQLDEVQREIQEFAKTHDRFEEARPLMGQLINMGKANGLDDAYALAMKVLAPEGGLKEQARPQRKLTRRKSTPNASSGSGMNGPSGPQFKTWDEAAADSFRRMREGLPL